MGHVIQKQQVQVVQNEAEQEEVRELVTIGNISYLDLYLLI